MKIVAFHIEGFGVFRGFAVRDLGDGLTLFYGPNEAGKSTLLDFIRFTLFGYPSRRSKDVNLHEPLRGGRHGGRIEILGENEDSATLERFVEKRKQRFGGDETLRRRLLRGVTRETFEAYFAFGLDELNEVRAKPPEDVEALLLDAGRAGRFRSPASVHNELEAQIHDLYRIKGRKKDQAIRAQLDRLKDLTEKIEECRRRPREYEEKRRDQAALEEKMAEAEKRTTDLRNSLDQDRQLSEVRGIFFKWRSAREAFEQTEKIDKFPPAGVSRLDELTEKISGLSREIDEKRGAIADLERTLREQTPDRRWLERADEIERLLRERSVQEERARRLDKEAADLRALRKDIDTQMQNLGADWTAEKVEAVATDLLAEDRLRKPHERIRSTQQSLETAARECEEARRRLEKMEADLKTEREAISARSLEEPQVLIERKKLIDEWLEEDLELSRRVVREEQLESDEARAASEAGKAREQLEAEKKKRVSLAPWLGVALVGAVAVVAAVFSLVRNQATWAIGFFATAAVLGFAAAQGILSSVRRRRETQARTVELEGDLAAAESELRRVRDELAGLQAEIEKLRSLQSDRASRAGIEPSSDRAAVIEARRRTETDLVHSTRLAAERKRLEDKERDVEAARQALLEREKERRSLDEQLAAARGVFRSALQAVGLPQDLSTDAALGAFERIRKLKGGLSEAERLRGEMAEKQAKLDEFIKRTKALAAELGMEPPDNWRVALAEMEQGLARERDTAQSERDLDQNLKTERRLLDGLEKQKREGEERLEKLLVKGGAPGDPEAFRERAEKAQQYQEALDALMQAKAGLDAHRPAGESPEHFLRRLEATDWVGLESRVADLESRLGQAKQELKQLGEQRGRLLKEIEDMEHEERLFDLRQQEEAARARLAELVRRWNVLTVADKLMAEIQKDYDEKRQPWRIQRASELFKRFTRGSFERIRVGEDGVSLSAVRQNLEELRPSRLSRGTKEQLYLSLRLALADELAEKRGIVFPLVFDDILVNFDDARARETAKTLIEVGRDRQVWFFTAHGPTREMFGAIGLAREINLPSA